MTAKTTTPQDHKTKKSAAKTIDVHGVSVSIDPTIFNDLNMFEDIYDIMAASDGDGSGVFKAVPLLRRLFGPAYPQVKRALTDPDGRIPLEKVSSTLSDVMEKLNLNS